MDELIKIQAKCKEYNITQNIIDTAKILYKKISDSKHSNTKKVRSLGGIGNIYQSLHLLLKLFSYLASGKLIMVSDLKVFK